jgi:hypothetical protein
MSSSGLRRRRAAAPTPPAAGDAAPPLSQHDRLVALLEQHKALTAAAAVLTSRLARTSAKLTQAQLHDGTRSSVASSAAASKATVQGSGSDRGRDGPHHKRTLPPTPASAVKDVPGAAQGTTARGGGVASAYKKDDSDVIRGLVQAVLGTASQPPAGSSAAGVGTHRLYFEDTHMFSGDATVMSVAAIDGGKYCIVLDRTVGRCIRPLARQASK